MFKHFAKWLFIITHKNEVNVILDLANNITVRSPKIPVLINHVNVLLKGK